MCFRSKKNGSRFTVLLNNMRIMGVFDWLLALKDYIAAEVDDPWKERKSTMLLHRQSCKFETYCVLFLL